MRLRGHNERINDMHFLNSRILGSSSVEGIKLWDLYKEKCEYTLKTESGPTALHFMPASSALAVGLDSHEVRLYSI